MQPLKVSITLSTPMVEPEHPIHLDGLLAALKVKAVQQVKGEGINPRAYHHDLPLERHEVDNGQWFFKASIFTAGNITRNGLWMQSSRTSLTEAARHRDEGWLALRSAKGNPAGGPFKTSIGYEQLMWTDLTAYCIGERESLEKLLQTCRQIGGRRGVGFGQVKTITVDSVSEKECRWTHRNMPVGSGADEGHAVIMGGVLPPYWDRRLHEPVLSPTDWML